MAEHKRVKRSCKLEETLPENVPVETVEHGIDENESACPECSTVMEQIGKEVRRTLVIVPAQVKIREDVYYSYACPKCRDEGAETPILKTPKAPAVIPGSHASAEAIAHIMTQKFVMASPLYRQEQEWKRAGVELSRQTMSNWVLTAARDWLMPVYNELHRKLLRHDILHADETTLQVLKEPGKSAQSKSYMWLYRTGIDAKHPIVLYEYKPNRKAENAEKFLDGFNGWLHADGYDGYHKLNDGIRVVGCWAHARRKFIEALNAAPEKERAGSAAAEGVAYCDALFRIEAEIKGLPYEDKAKQRRQTGAAGSGRAVGMVRDKERTSEVYTGQGPALSEDAMAAPHTLPRGREAGDKQQPCREEHQAVRHRAQEFPVRQHAERSAGQRRNLQPHRDCKGKRP